MLIGLCCIGYRVQFEFQCSCLCKIVLISLHVYYIGVTANRIACNHTVLIQNVCYDTFTCQAVAQRRLPSPIRKKTGSLQVMDKFKATHNHKLYPELYAHYPKHSKLTESETRKETITDYLECNPTNADCSEAFWKSTDIVRPQELQAERYTVTILTVLIYSISVLQVATFASKISFSTCHT